ncbi:MAG: diaminopimelate decarboxylase [Planctomycetota bacterium]
MNHGLQFPDGGLCPVIGAHSVADLARRYGTPTYLYDASVIERQVASLRQFEVIRYAQKANSNLAVLDLLRRLGVVVDAVSAGELLRAKAAGYALTGDPHPVVYTADIFDRDSLDLVCREGVHVNCGSPDMLDQYGERCPGQAVTLRINPGFGHGHSQKTNTGGPQSKHGIWHTQIGDCLERCRRWGLRVTGLHMHIGSGTDFEHLSQVCGAMVRTAREVGNSLTTISAGGGLPTPYRVGDQPIDIARYFELWDSGRRELQAEFGHPIRLELEPGRYPVAESGYLITEIRAIKRMGDNLFYLVDAGFNNLARPILYGAYHPMAIARAGNSTEKANQPVIVGGPLCESGDIFTQTDGGTVVQRQLPTAQVGDYLVIGCAGAYGFVMGSNYNSEPLAAEVLLRGDKDYLVRPRQSSASLFESESIPQ